MKCVTVYLKHLVRLEVSVSENDAMVEVVDGVRTVSSSASVDDSCMLATLGVEQQLWLLWPCCGLWLCNPLLLLLLLLLTSCILCVLILRDYTIIKNSSTTKLKCKKEDNLKKCD